MKIGFTGTRKGLTQSQKLKLIETLEKLHPSHVYHGDCIGADTEFHNICEDLAYTISICPPTDTKLRSFLQPTENGIVFKEKPYLSRNKDIVDFSDIVIVCPETKEEKLRSGTWSTWRYAKKKEKQIILILP